MNIIRNAPHQPDPIEYSILDIENSSYLSLQNTTPLLRPLTTMLGMN